ncbi:MAG: HAMP domain-containing histidine kinase, partial [Deinococcus sp.]|nr:HAMP domain-containing histidine kinase [Deinococcus sp.]
QQRLDLDCPDDLAVVADRPKLKAALINLLDGAVKGASPGGVVALTCYQTGEQLRLQVATDLQLGNPSASLGLSIVRRLMELQGGTVLVESGSSGTICALLLPLRSAGEALG